MQPRTVHAGSLAVRQRHRAVHPGPVPGATSAAAKRVTMKTHKSPRAAAGLLALTAIPAWLPLEADAQAWFQIEIESEAQPHCHIDSLDPQDEGEDAPRHLWTCHRHQAETTHRAYHAKRPRHHCHEDRAILDDETSVVQRTCHRHGSRSGHGSAHPEPETVTHRSNRPHAKRRRNDSPDIVWEPHLPQREQAREQALEQGKGARVLYQERNGGEGAVVVTREGRTGTGKPCRQYHYLARGTRGPSRTACLEPDGRWKERAYR